MNKTIKTIITYFIFLGLGILLVWWSVKDLTAADQSQIQSALKAARYWLIFPIFIILFSSHYVRALRWRLLIESIGYIPSRKNAFFAVMIGYITNQAVPRLGEVVKCTLLARYEKIPAEKLIGTVILERIIDALSLLFIFGITLAIQPHLYAQLINTFFNSSKNEEEKKLAGWIVGLIIIGIISLIIIAWMIIKKKNPNDLIQLFKKLGRNIWQGVSSIQHLKKRKQFILLTILLWVLYLSGGYIGFKALKETQDYGIREAFSVLSAGSVGMIATPGGIGAYAFLIKETMILYGLSSGIAVAFGWILWVAQTTAIIVGGLISFVLMPFLNKQTRLEKS